MAAKSRRNLCKGYANALRGSGQNDYAGAVGGEISFISKGELDALGVK